MRQFLHDGTKLRYKLIASVIKKLQELCDVLKREDTFRFYTSSLLIMYDGQEEIDSGLDHGDSASGSKGIGRLSGCGKAYLSSSQSSRVEGTAVFLAEQNGIDNNYSASKMTLADAKSSSLFVKECHAVASSSTTKDQNADVKMIDFAHATHSKLGDSCIHKGPDKGYIFGLENMITIFKSLQHENFC